MVATLGGIAVLAVMFAQVEIQIEGADGWAAKLPTWRMPPNLFLKLFWGGREMTGYHAWVFPFVALMFHYPMLHGWRWTWRLQARALAAPMLFWIIEDAMWFVMNPAFGLGRLKPGHVPWHPHWVLGLPVDYWMFSVAGLALLWWSLGEDRA
jgi:hypothetical protein